MLDRLAIPIVQAPMAGGPSTPELAAAVCEAGALGFLAAGYKTAGAMAADIAATRALTGRPFGVNVFAAPAVEPDAATVEAYARRVAETTADTGVAPGAPRTDDDAFAEKVAVLLDVPVGVVSFAFGCPSAELVGRLREAGSAVWVTITRVDEAVAATAAGADALIVQGVEAGGHRGGFDDDAPGDLGLLALLQLVCRATPAPLVASGGIATGAGVAAVLCAGAAAAQVGTALMCSDEAATAPAQRAALQRPGRTALTRAFSGRTARGIVNGFMEALDAEAPAAYPAVHHVTAPIRAHARAHDDADRINLWAGQAHELACSAPAAEIVGDLWADARAALDAARRRFAPLDPSVPPAG